MKHFVFSTTVVAISMATVIGFGVGESAAAEADAVPYSAGGHSRDQERDRFECHRWAVRQSGYDPTTNVPEPSRPDRGATHRGGGSTGFLGIGGDKNALGGEGGLVSDAATGAALGAIGGALAGDAGVGALAGAGAGALLGQLFRQSSPRPPAKHAETPPPYPALAEYRRAYNDCMIYRGYERE